MFLGTGKLEVRLMNPDGTVAEVIVPSRPTARLFQDFEDVIDDYGLDIDKSPITVFKGVKFRAVWQWVSHKSNQTQMANVRKIGNWRSAGKFINVWPHQDMPQIQLRCEVTRHSTSPISGQVAGDVMEIEVQGLDLLERKPNPLYDRVGKLFRRGSVNTTARSFGS